MPRHDGRVIWLTYKPEGTVKKTVYLVSLFFCFLRQLNTSNPKYLNFTSPNCDRLARGSPMTPVALTSRLEESWQVNTVPYETIFWNIQLPFIRIEVDLLPLKHRLVAGMSRDKCGAAATAGLMASIAALQPQGVKVGELR